MLRENGNKEAKFDVSKLTVFCVDVYSNEDSRPEDTTEKSSEKSSEKILNAIRKNPKITVAELSSSLKTCLLSVYQLFTFLSMNFGQTNCTI